MGTLAVTIVSTKPVNTPPFGDILGVSRGQNDISHEWSPGEGLHVPVGQGMQISAADAASSVKPASQTQLLAAEAETEPALQGQKWLPGIELDWEGHTKQSPTPPDTLYVPASQLVQMVEAAAAAYSPASQFSQSADPDVALNLPATQDEQSPSGPVKPALH